MTNEQLTTFIKARPITVSCGLLCVILGLGIYFRSDDVPHAETQLDEKSMQGERIDANLKNGVGLSEQLAALTAARVQMETRLIRADEIAKNQGYFYKLGTDTNIKVVDLHQSAAAKATKGPKLNYQPIGYTLVVRGNYSQILDFLRRLEAGSIYNRVMSATMNSGMANDKDRAGDLTITLNLELLGEP